MGPGVVVETTRSPDALDGIEGGVEGLVDRRSFARDHQSSWPPAELIRELAGAAPTTMAVDPQQLTGSPALADESPIVVSTSPAPIPPQEGAPGLQTLSPNRQWTERSLPSEILDEEEELIAWAERRRRHECGSRPLHINGQLTPAQVAAVAAVADGDGWS